MFPVTTISVLQVYRLYYKQRLYFKQRNLSVVMSMFSITQRWFSQIYLALSMLSCRILKLLLWKKKVETGYFGFWSYVLMTIPAELGMHNRGDSACLEEKLINMRATFIRITPSVKALALPCNPRTISWWWKARTNQEEDQLFEPMPSLKLLGKKSCFLTASCCVPMNESADGQDNPVDDYELEVIFIE